MKMKPYSLLVIMLCFMPAAVFLLKAKGQKVEYANNVKRVPGCRLHKLTGDAVHPSRF
jgi:hypothetical protein